MRAVVQRVLSARVEVDGSVAAEIGPGLVALVGVEQGDTETEAAWIAEKPVHLRIFEDDAGKMNRSLRDTGGSLLLVPNFTVAGDARKGGRPTFDNAMRPEQAEPLFARLCALAASHSRVQAGVFRARMRVSLVNDGPVTIWLDSGGAASSPGGAGITSRRHSGVARASPGRRRPRR